MVGRPAKIRERLLRLTSMFTFLLVEELALLLRVHQTHGILVVACNRSGSSLGDDATDTHQDIYANDHAHYTRALYLFEHWYMCVLLDHKVLL